MEEAYIEQLSLVREFFENNFPKFPTDYCDYSARFLKKVYGFEERGGFHHNEGILDFHAWAYCSKINKDLDITQDQFPYNDNKIYISSPNQETLELHKTLCQDYREVEDSQFENLDEMIEKFKKENKKSIKNFNILTN